MSRSVRRTVHRLDTYTDDRFVDAGDINHFELFADTNESRQQSGWALPDQFVLGGAVLAGVVEVDGQLLGVLPLVVRQAMVIRLRSFAESFVRVHT